MVVEANVVRNVGTDDADTGLRVSRRAGWHDWQGDAEVCCAYTQAETGAVFAAFSHANTTLATNYRQHAVCVENVLISSTGLSLVWYLYRPLDSPSVAASYTSRLRINTSVSC